MSYRREVRVAAILKARVTSGKVAPKVGRSLVLVQAGTLKRMRNFNCGNFGLQVFFILFTLWVMQEAASASLETKASTAMVATKSFMVLM